MADGATPTIAELVTQCHAELYRFAYRLTGSVADSEDLVQQTFLVAAQRLSQVREATTARGWLFAVLRNSYLKSRRRTRPASAASLSVDIDELADLAGAGGHPGETNGRWDDWEFDEERLQLALNELPDDFKVVLLLYYFEERPYQEIADELSIPIGTVMSRLARAKAHLRRQLVTEEPARKKPPSDRPRRART